MWPPHPPLGSPQPLPTTSPPLLYFTASSFLHFFSRKRRSFLWSSNYSSQNRCQETAPALWRGKEGRILEKKRPSSICLPAPKPNYVSRTMSNMFPEINVVCERRVGFEKVKEKSRKITRSSTMSYVV